MMRGLPPPHPRFNSLVWMILLHQKTIVPGVMLCLAPIGQSPPAWTSPCRQMTIVPGVTLPSARLDNHRQSRGLPDHAESSGDRWAAVV